MLTHPLLLQGWLVWKYANDRSSLSFYVLTIFFLIVLPILIYGTYLRLLQLKNYFVLEKKYRYFPLLLNVVLLSLCRYFVKIPEEVYILLLFVNLVVFFYTFFQKISLHLASLGSLCVFFLLKSEAEYLIVGSFVLAGVVGWARYYLRAHTTLELAVGWLVGSVSSMLAVFYWVWEN